jgi:hypothetical protein
MKNSPFNEMISGFVDAKKQRAGKKAKMRVSRVAFEPVSMEPAEIRRVGTLRSWEQGSRKPQSSALRLSAIAKEKPALLLQRSA